MTERATKLPKHFEKPEHWTDAPAPEPAPPEEGAPDEGKLSPTRYGDWVSKGIAIDF